MRFHLSQENQVEMVVVVKLDSGEDIICSVAPEDLEADEPTILVLNPLRIIQTYDLKTNDTNIHIVRWMGYSDDEGIIIPRNHIIGTCGVGEEIIDYYYTLVDEWNEQRKMNENERKLIDEGNEKEFETHGDWLKWMEFVHSQPSKTIH